MDVNVYNKDDRDNRTVFRQMGGMVVPCTPEQARLYEREDELEHERQLAAIRTQSCALVWTGTPDFTKIVVPAEARLPQRLMRGKECEELAKEINTIRHKRTRGGLAVPEIQTECSSFEIWKRVEVLSPEDKDTFMHPGTWEPGYANLLLGKLYAETQRNVAAATINTWRKEYRAYLKWEHDNPTKTADDFSLELQDRKRSYRKRPVLKQVSPSRRRP